MKTLLFCLLHFVLCFTCSAQTLRVRTFPARSDSISHLATSIDSALRVRNDTVLNVRQSAGRYVILQIDTSRFLARADTFVYKPWSDQQIAGEEKMRHRLNRGVQFFILLFTTILLIIIWLYYVMTLEPVLRRMDPCKDDGRDYGILLLAMAMLFWGLMSLAALLGQESPALTFLLSTLNNAFFLASLTFFEHGFLKKRNQRHYWEIIVISISLFCFFLCLLLFHSKQYSLAYTVDAVFSISTFALLGYNLEKTFRARNMPVLSRFSWLVMNIAILAQLIIFIRDIYEKSAFDTYFGSVIWDSVIYIVSQAALATIFISLAFTWINEKSAEVSLARTFQIVTDYQLPKINYLDKPTALATIEELIKNGNMLAALEAMRLYCQSNSNQDELHNTTMLSSDFHHTTAEYVHGLISRDQYGLVRNRVTNALLIIIKELRNQHGIEPPSPKEQGQGDPRS